MALHPVIYAVPLALLAMGVVYADAIRRSLHSRARLAWTFAVGVLSLAGYVGVFAYDGLLFRTYMQLLGDPLIARSPRGVFLWLLVTGVVISGVGVGIYIVGSRIAWRRPVRT